MNFRAFIYRTLFPFARIYWKFVPGNRSGAGCIILFEDKMLLIRQTYGKSMWCFPGGGINKNEDPKDAAIREVWEEVGIRLSDAKLIEEITGTNQDNKVYIFESITKYDSFKIDPGEILEAKWFPIQEPPEEMSSLGKRMYDIWRNKKSV